MKYTQTIFDLISSLSKVENEQINKYLKFGQKVQLFSGSSKLLELDKNTITLCGQNITNKILATRNTLVERSKNDQWNNFLSELDSSLIRLNHLGISYCCSDFESEILYYKKILANQVFSLYEEQSGEINSKWLFLGDTSDWQAPLFEIVLTKSVQEPENIWRPHFQIDIDTKLDQQELASILSKYFGNDFIQWKLDIPNYGIVLNMGMLSSDNGTKVYLGIGNNLRDTKYHRRDALQPI